jgi:hypothetical protein
MNIAFRSYLLPGWSLVIIFFIDGKNLGSDNLILFVYNQKQVL